MKAFFATTVLALACASATVDNESKLPFDKKYFESIAKQIDAEAVLINAKTAIRPFDSKDYQKEGDTEVKPYMPAQKDHGKLFDATDIVQSLTRRFLRIYDGTLKFIDA